jgi:hypothetical protein
MSTRGLTVIHDVSTARNSGKTPVPSTSLATTMCLPLLSEWRRHNTAAVVWTAVSCITVAAQIWALKV